LNIRLNGARHSGHSVPAPQWGVMNPALPLHLGALHPYEQLLVALVAFGPFAVLFVVVYVVRRRDVAAEDADLTEGQAATATPASDDPEG
jgi:hypothetical protein